MSHTNSVNTPAPGAKKTRHPNSLLKKTFSFLREWLRNPLTVAAIAPSGRALATMITKDINWLTGPVIELGPGTGVFTRRLIERGVRQGNLTLVEYGSDFARILQNDFPHARTLWMDAAWLTQTRLFDGAPVGAVVCGLGLLNMKPEKIKAILNGCFAYLRPEGAFYLFTYGPRCSVPDEILQELGLEVSFVGRTFSNIPPASVYKITRITRCVAD
jgi:phosphatidylethanolamine/phosphatidyl-N-methylethanolamine N-methyltransferase